MIHTQVYGFFQTCLPDQAKEVKEYFPNGKNSIRIRKTNGQEFIFSFRKQRSFNRSTVMVATVMTVHMLIQDLEIRSMRDEIGNLKNEIKELRKTEGD